MSCHVLHVVESRRPGVGRRIPVGSDQCRLFERMEEVRHAARGPPRPSIPARLVGYWPKTGASGNRHGGNLAIVSYCPFRCLPPAVAPGEYSDFAASSLRYRSDASRIGRIRFTTADVVEAARSLGHDHVTVCISTAAAQPCRDVGRRPPSRVAPPTPPRVTAPRRPRPCERHDPRKLDARP